MKLLRVILLVAGFEFMACPQVNATDVSRIVVVVNKEAITTAEIEERIRLMNLSAGKSVTTPIPEAIRKQIIQGMIDESIQLQMTKLKKIIISDADVEKSLTALAKDNNMSFNAMLAMLKSNSISKETMMRRIRAQMAWGRYIREMHGPLVHISDQEIDTLMKKIKEVKLPKPSTELMDISLCQAIFPITPDASEEIMMIIGPKIEETYQAKGCTDFLKKAREFGATVDANRVVKLGQLPPNLKPMVQKTKAGACMAPIRTEGGVVLTMVCSKTMPKVEEPPALTRETAFQEKEQEILGKKAVQEMAKLRRAACIEWK